MQDKQIKVEKMPAQRNILTLILPRRLLRWLQVLMYPTGAIPEQDWEFLSLPNEACYRFEVDASDATDADQLPAHDLRLLISELVATLKQENIPDEIHQLLIDLKRSTVFNNGQLIKSDPTALFESLTTEIATSTKLPLPMVRNAVSRLNQSVGNFSLEFLMQFIKDCRYEDGMARAFLPLMRSPKCTATFSREENKLRMTYTLPLQVVPYDDVKFLERLERHDDSEDLMATSTMTLDLAAAKSDTPKSVVYELQIDTKSPVVTIEFPGQDQFISENRRDGFCTVEEIKEDECVVVTYTPPRIS